MWYDYKWCADGSWDVFVRDGHQVEVLMHTRSLERAERAVELYDKYGHGELRYPRKW